MSPPTSSALRGAATMAAYGAAHSALASATVKRLAARVVGERARDAFYRPFYLAQSVAATVWLGRALRRIPEHTLAVYPPPVHAVLRGAHVAAGAFGVWALVSARIGRISGLDAVARAASGRRVRPTPPAHGPYGRGGQLHVEGPFRRTRHPLNVAFLPMLWSARRLTTRRLGAALVGTAYLFAGSVLEERRNRAAYGAAYDRYRRRVPFFWPRLRAADQAPMSARGEQPGRAVR
ncbi:MAG TPA: hypothetical protein VGB53_09840 [Rubricoccaceae bacterium]